MKIAFLSLAVSLALTASPALAGWGTNGQYGNTPTGGSSGTSTSTNTGGGYGGNGSMGGSSGGSSGGVWNNGGESTGGGYGGDNGQVWNGNGGGGYPKGGSSKQIYCLATDQVANMVQQRGYLIYAINYSNGRFVVNVADQNNYPYILKFNCQGKLTSSTKIKVKKSYGGNGGGNQGYAGNGGGQDWGGGNQGYGGNGGNQNWGGGGGGYGGNGGGIQVWGGNGGGYGGNGPNW